MIQQRLLATRGLPPGAEAAAHEQRDRAGRRDRGAAVRRQPGGDPVGQAGGQPLVPRLTGLLVVLVIRMLGELATALLAAGSFYEYAARLALGDLAGFGYRLDVLVLLGRGHRGVRGHRRQRRPDPSFWFPQFPQWSLALALLLIATATNLRSGARLRRVSAGVLVSASIKVGAIAVFLGLGASYVAGLWFGRSSLTRVANLTAHGGFAPRGLAGRSSPGAVAATWLLFRGRDRHRRRPRDQPTSPPWRSRGPPPRSSPGAGVLGQAPIVPAWWRSCPGIRRPSPRPTSARWPPSRRAGGRPSSVNARDPDRGAASALNSGLLCLLADAAGADPPRRPRRWLLARCEPARHAGAGDPGRHGGRLRRGDDVVHLAGRGVPLPGQVERHGGAVRLPC